MHACVSWQLAAIVWGFLTLAASGSLPCQGILLPAQPVNERLRLLGGTAKVALDLLEYDSQLERAFITICGCAVSQSSHCLPPRLCLSDRVALYREHSTPLLS